MRAIILLPVLLLAACSESSRDAEPVIAAPATVSERPRSEPVAPPAAVPVAPAKADPVAASVEHGRYTSLAGAACKTEELGDELGGTRTTCAGIAPYRLIVTDSDARQMLDVVEGQGKPQPLQLAQKVSAAFSDLGDTVEWWPQGDAAPSALITRFNAYEHPEQPDRTTSYLVIAKLKAGQRSCVTEVIPPGPSQNMLAREAAARAPAAPCKADRY